MTGLVILVVVILGVAAMGVLSALGRTPDSRSRDYSVGSLLARESDRH